MEILNMLRSQLEALNNSRAAAVTELEVLGTAITARQAALDPRIEAETNAETRAALQAERNSMTAEESTSLDTLQARITGLDTEIGPLAERVAEIEDIAARTAAANAVQRRAPVPGSAGRAEDIDPMSHRVPVSELASRARTVIEESRMFISDAHRSAVTAIIDRSPVMLVEDGHGELRNDNTGTWVARMTLATCSPLYFRAWSKYMTGQYLEIEEQAALARAQQVQRAMSVGTPAAGGFLVPTPLDPTLIITGAGSANPFRQISRIIQLAQGNTWKGVSAGQISASWSAEASAAPDAAPTVAQPTIPTFTADLFVPASMEAFEDIDNLAQDIATLFTDAKDNHEAQAFATGTGVGQPKGVMVAVAAVAGSRVASAGVGAYAVADVYNVHQALPARHRIGSEKSRAWVAAVATINRTRQFPKFTGATQSIVEERGAGQAPTLQNELLLEASSVSANVATGQDILGFGDFRKYGIVDKVGFVTEYIPHLFDQATARPSGQRGFYAHWRVGADVLDPDAFRVLRIA